MFQRGFEDERHRRYLAEAISVYGSFILETYAHLQSSERGISALDHQLRFAGFPAANRSTDSVPDIHFDTSFICKDTAVWVYRLFCAPPIS